MYLSTLSGLVDAKRKITKTDVMNFLYNLRKRVCETHYIGGKGGGEISEWINDVSFCTIPLA